MNDAVVLFSGGQDSTTCLAWAIREWGRDNVHPVSFDYGQKHEVELEQAKKICQILEVDKPYLIPAEALNQLSSAALTNPTIKVEAKASESSGNAWAYSHNLPSTFVPGRNMLFLTLAAAYGARYGIKDLVTGICATDRAGYPDCREEFRIAAQDALSQALDDVITIHAPVIHLNKAQTFSLAEHLGVLQVVVNFSHTCYMGNRSNSHDWGYGCGECPACQERAKGWDEYKKMLESVKV